MEMNEHPMELILVLDREPTFGQAIAQDSSWVRTPIFNG